MLASSDQNEADFSAFLVLTVASHCASVARMADSTSATLTAGCAGFAYCVQPSRAAASRSASAIQKCLIAILAPFFIAVHPTVGKESNTRRNCRNRRKRKIPLRPLRPLR